MFEVQAVIARTYAAAQSAGTKRDGFDLCSTTHCQLYQPARLQTSRWAPLAAEAADTAAQVLWFDGAPASALFHADCGGHTSAAGDVWGGTAAPTCPARRHGAGRGAHATGRYEMGRGELRAALNADARTRVGEKLERHRGRRGATTPAARDDRALKAARTARARRGAPRGPHPRVRRKVDPKHAIPGVPAGRALRLRRQGVRPRRRAVPGRRLRPPRAGAGPSRCSRATTRHAADRASLVHCQNCQNCHNCQI